MNPRFRWYILALLIVALIALANIGHAQPVMRRVTDLPEFRTSYRAYTAQTHTFVAVQLPEGTARVIVARGKSEAQTSPAAAQEGWSIIPVNRDGLPNQCFAIFLTMDQRGAPYARACLNDLPEAKMADLQVSRQLTANRLSIGAEAVDPVGGICAVNGVMTYTTKLPCATKADVMYGYPCDGVRALPHCNPPATMTYKAAQFYAARGCKTCRVTALNTTRYKFVAVEMQNGITFWRYAREDTGGDPILARTFFRLPENDDR